MAEPVRDFNCKDTISSRLLPITLRDVGLDDFDGSRERSHRGSRKEIEVRRTHQGGNATALELGGPAAVPVRHEGDSVDAGKEGDSRPLPCPTKSESRSSPPLCGLTQLFPHATPSSRSALCKASTRTAGSTTATTATAGRHPKKFSSPDRSAPSHLFAGPCRAHNALRPAACPSQSSTSPQPSPLSPRTTSSPAVPSLPHLHHPSSPSGTGPLARGPIRVRSRPPTTMLAFRRGSCRLKSR